MYALLVLIAGVAFVSADIGLGYNYKPPHYTHYGSVNSGSPSYPSGGYFGQYNNGYESASGMNYNYKLPSSTHGSSVGYQNTYNKYQGGNGNGYQGGNLYFGSNSYKPASLPSSGYNQASSSEVNGYGSGQSFNQHHQSQYNYQNNYQYQQQPAKIFKHFYVHAAPEDEEPPKPRGPVVLPAPQKHYKIIFIKTPSQHYGGSQIIPVPQQNEEKTIVYVLVKKPDQIQDVALPKFEQKPPAKPEVFFIKYNSKEGSQAVIDNIVKDYNKGESASFSSASSSDSSSSVSQYNPGPTVITSFDSSKTQNQLSSDFNSQSGNYVGGSSGSQNSASSGFESATFGQGAGSNYQNQGSSGFVTQPLEISSPGGAIGTTATSIIGSGTTATATTGNGYNTGSLDSISTSQGVPHETYGVPFRV